MPPMLEGQRSWGERLPQTEGHLHRETQEAHSALT